MSEADNTEIITDPTGKRYIVDYSIRDSNDQPLIIPIEDDEE